MINKKSIKKIRVGNRVYKFKEVMISNEFENYERAKTEGEIYSGLGLLGQVCPKSRTIWVKKTGITKLEQKQVLFHEIAHALMIQMKKTDRRYFDFKPMAILNHDERFIDDFSRILMKTFEIKSLIPKTK